MAHQSFFPTLVCFLAFAVVTVHSFAITGVSGGVNQSSGARPFRTEINDFANSGAPFDLYILSLQKLQQENQSDQLSYFQIAGIHGYPTIEWDGAPGNANWGWGYCHHDIPLFPPWHRPYMALYEQALWQTAQTIASQYTGDQQGQYVQAAVRFRAPFWDFALNPSMPSVATSPQITVNTPTGSQTIDNPLFNYTFHTRPAGNGFPTTDASGSPSFSTEMSTLRWPDSNGQSQNDVATQNLQQNAAFLISTLYNIFTSGPNYTEISTDANSQTSIEYLHDAVHYFVGGDNGHMDFLQWAGFDPMFWLHHANVDRIFAMWQALYPNSYVEPAQTGGNYGLQPGSTVTETTNLEPFHSDNSGTFYNADTVRATKTFGYAYPDVVDWNVSASQLTANVRQRVNQLYNPNAGSNTSKKSKRIARRDVTSITDKLLSTVKRITVDMFHELDVNNQAEQWTANLQVNKYALNSSFNVEMFLGPPPANEADWPLAPNLMGTFAVLSSAGIAPPSHESNGVTKYGQIPLTAALAAAVQGGVINDLESASVIPLLQDNLHVRATNSKGATIEDLDGFQVTVSSRSVTPPATASDFPEYGDWVDYPEIIPNLNN